MKINSELPNCMLDVNNQLNEYDFVLFHLYESNIQYREYYLNQRRLYPNRLMIFDNSAYEYYVKGETLDLHLYYEAICELCPDYYILPDVLMDKDKTVQGVSDFLQLYELGIVLNTGKSQPLAVAQGITPNELLDCLDIYKALGITNICIPFHNRFFYKMGQVVHKDIQQHFVNVYGPVLTEDHMYAMGRVLFVYNNIKKISDFDYVHLLGSHCPFEKSMYGSAIDSMDTGYPVKCAIVGEKLGEEKCKPNVIIDEFLDKELDKETIDLINENVTIFREL